MGSSPRRLASNQATQSLTSTQSLYYLLTQALCAETGKLHEVFSHDLTNLVQEIAILKEKVKKNPHELKKHLIDRLRPLEDELMVGEDSQKH